MREKLVVSVIAAAMGWSVIATAELDRFWSGDYPAWLLAPPPAVKAERLRDDCGQPLLVVDKGDGTSLVRCGLYWPAARVWAMSQDVQLVGLDASR